MSGIIETIRHTIIVSCQALPGEPLYCEEMSLMPFMAEAAKRAGCRCIRTNSVRDVTGIREATGLPVIGIIKRQYEGYDGYITPTMKEIDELAEAGADIVALDCTMRKRGDGSTVGEFLKEIRGKYPDMLLMADISNLEEGIHAWKCGVNLVSTTMSGYTGEPVSGDGPDLELVRALSEAVDIPVIAEGRIHFPEQARAAFEAGAYAVVVGGAITRPLEIAQRFFRAIP